MPLSCHVSSPIGELILLSDDTRQRLAALWIVGEKHAPPARSDWRRDDRALPEVRRQLREYFSGRRQAFELPLAPIGTPFQLLAWQALQAIPYGTTMTYGQQAAAIGKPFACRAIGLANGRNPISIIIPCHRVIGADGALTGYGGGLAAKRWLLEHEARHTMKKTG